MDGVTLAAIQIHNIGVLFARITIFGAELMGAGILKRLEVYHLS